MKKLIVLLGVAGVSVSALLVRWATAPSLVLVVYRMAFAAALLLLYGKEPEENDREIAPFLAKNLTKAQIMSTIELLETYYGECAYNVGVGHVLGALAAELEGIL